MEHVFELLNRPVPLWLLLLLIAAFAARKLLGSSRYKRDRSADNAYGLKTARRLDELENEFERVLALIRNGRQT
jgi:hypothetical protein